MISARGALVTHARSMGVRKWVRPVCELITGSSWMDDRHGAWGTSSTVPIFSHPFARPRRVWQVSACENTAQKAFSRFYIF